MGIKLCVYSDVKQERGGVVAFQGDKGKNEMENRLSANKRNPSGMCVRIKSEGIPETYCLHCAGACGTWRYAFIMMSDLSSCDCDAAT